MTSAVSIPTIDLSTLFLDKEEERKRKAKDIIKQACSKYSLFKMVNHGIPINVINQAMEQCKDFFHLSDEDKLRYCTDHSHLPYGYRKHKADKNEYLYMSPPGTTANIFPTNPPNFQ